MRSLERSLIRFLVCLVAAGKCMLISSWHCIKMIRWFIVHFTLQILLRLLHLIPCNANRAACVNRQGEQNTSVRLWFTNNHPRKEREGEQKDTNKKHFEEKYCFTKHLRLTIAAWLPACLWESQYTTMPDNRESLICQLVGRSVDVH